MTGRSEEAEVRALAGEVRMALYPDPHEPYVKNANVALDILEATVAAQGRVIEALGDALAGALIKNGKTLGAAMAEVEYVRAEAAGLLGGATTHAAMLGDGVELTAPAEPHKRLNLREHKHIVSQPPSGRAKETP